MVDVAAVGHEERLAAAVRRTMAQAVSRSGTANATIGMNGGTGSMPSWVSEIPIAATTKPRNIEPASPMMIEAGCRL